MTFSPATPPAPARTSRRRCTALLRAAARHVALAAVSGAAHAVVATLIRLLHLPLS